MIREVDYRKEFAPKFWGDRDYRKETIDLLLLLSNRSQASSGSWLIAVCAFFDKLKRSSCVRFRLSSHHIIAFWLVTVRPLSRMPGCSVLGAPWQLWALPDVVVWLATIPALLYLAALNF
jgi:hypothetical protein